MAVSLEPAAGPGPASTAHAVGLSEPGPSRRPSQTASASSAAAVAATDASASQPVHRPSAGHARTPSSTQPATPASPETAFTSVAEPAPQFDIATFPTQTLLRLLARILQQIAAANDHLRPDDDDVDMADAAGGDDASASARSVRSARSASHQSSLHPSPASTLFHGDSDAGGDARAVSDPETLFTASRSSLCVPSSLLSFHARHVPSITIEAYLLRILKYCPTTNEVFLGLLVYFDRMSKLGTPSGVGGLTAAVGPRGFAIDSFNVHRLVIAGVTVASKFFSDVFYTNSRYAKVGGLPPQELNQLELQFLLLNDFRLCVAPEEMQKYGNRLLAYSAGQEAETGIDAVSGQDARRGSRERHAAAGTDTSAADAGAARAPSSTLSASTAAPAPGDPAYPGTQHPAPREPAAVNPPGPTAPIAPRGRERDRAGAQPQPAAGTAAATGLGIVGGLGGGEWGGGGGAVSAGRMSSPMRE